MKNTLIAMIIAGLGALLLSTAPASAQAQEMVGEVDTPFLGSALQEQDRLTVCLSCSPTTASPERWSNPGNTLNHVSTAVFVGGNVADLLSSCGGYEMNPLARSADGRFSMGKGLAVKAVYVGGVLLMERLVGGRSGRGRGFFTKMKMVTGGVFVGVATRNWRLK